MSRGLKGFLVFCAVLILLAGSIAVYLGTNVLAFIFHSDRSSAPVVMLNLVQFRDKALEQTYLANFKAPIEKLYATYGAEKLMVATTDRVVQGKSYDEWQRIEFVNWPSRAAFIEMVTSGEYADLSQVRKSTTEARAWIAATPHMRVELVEFKAYVLRLQRFDNRASRNAYFSEWQTPDAESPGIGSSEPGAIVLAADLNALEASQDQRWQYLQLYGFPDKNARESWLGDEIRETQWSLERKLFERDVLVSIDQIE